MTDMVSRWQTVEDGCPRDGVDRWIKQEGETGLEHVFVAIPVRDAVTHGLMTAHVIVRASQVTGEITLALEPYHVEDGA